MIAGLHIGSNFRKFGHGKLPPLAIIAITLIPLLFGGLFVLSLIHISEPTRLSLVSRMPSSA